MMKITTTSSIGEAHLIVPEADVLDTVALFHMMPGVIGVSVSIDSDPYI